ncbi:hypothetical protein [Streptomyces sp. NPDC057199]|uniref:hypothetical protein n=1 Tax=Streptomyces sp. NPDC057199 TaxID=3346047 RepID=UPI0036260BA2
MYGLLRRQRPIARVTTPAGDPAWLVTGFEEARQIYGDGHRFRRSHHAPEASRLSNAVVLKGPISSSESKGHKHDRTRRMLMPAFSAPRMRRLSDRIQELTEGLLDDMEAARKARPDEPVDLHDLLAFPLPVQVICELLGVPAEDRDYFRDWSQRMGSKPEGIPEGWNRGLQARHTAWIRDGWRDSLRFSILEEEWHAENAE